MHVGIGWQQVEDSYKGRGLDFINLESYLVHFNHSYHPKFVSLLSCH